MNNTCPEISMVVEFLCGTAYEPKTNKFKPKHVGQLNVLLS